MASVVNTVVRQLLRCTYLVLPSINCCECEHAKLFVVQSFATVDVKLSGRYRRMWLRTIRITSLKMVFDARRVMLKMKPNVSNSSRDMAYDNSLDMRQCESR